MQPAYVDPAGLYGVPADNDAHVLHDAAPAFEKEPAPRVILVSQVMCGVM